MLTFPKPAALHSPTLERELSTAGFQGQVTDMGDGTIRVTEVDDPDRDAVQSVIDAHVPPAPPVEVTSRQRLRELKAKGWQNLTATEKQEVAQRVLEALV